MPPTATKKRKFFTVKELATLYGPVAEVKHVGKYVYISLAGGEDERDCPLSARGKCRTVTVRPRIKIRTF